MSNFWTRTSQHLALSQSVCSNRCSIAANCQTNDKLHFDSSSFGSCLMIFTNDSSSGSLDCTVYHLHQWLIPSLPIPAVTSITDEKSVRFRIKEHGSIDRKKTQCNQTNWVQVTEKTVVLIRSVGLTSDSIFIGDVCRSLLIELGLCIDRQTYTNNNVLQLFDELGRSLASDIHLVILLLGIDRLLPSRCHHGNFISIQLH